VPTSSHCLYSNFTTQLAQSMKAILWDGHKQIEGELNLQADQLIFEFEDFKNSSIKLDIRYSDISDVTFKKLYNIESAGIQIKTIDGKEDVFILSDTSGIFEILKTKLK
jgi:hypothetical protein